MNSSRRHFLATAGFLPVSTLLHGEKNGRSPLSFGTYGLPGYSLADSIKLIADVGFDSIEIASMPGYHGDPDKLTKPQRTEVRQRVADSGLILGALMGFPKPDPKKQAQNTVRIEQMLELAVDLGGDQPPLLQSVLGGGAWDERKAMLRDCLGPWVELADKAGVKFCIKPHRGGSALSRPNQAVWLIDQLDAKGKMGLVYDHSHYIYREMNVVETVAGALEHTAYIVVKDAVQSDDGKVSFTLPGEGKTMPHVEILRQFHAGGYRGEICCEVSSMVWRKDGYNPKAATETCYRNLRKMAEESGIF